LADPARPVRGRLPMTERLEGLRTAMQINPPCLIAIIAALVTIEAALGHHSVAQFDVERTVSLDAVVTEFEWANPHVYIELETLDSARAPTRWMIEGGPPNLMARAGWSARSLIIGETVTAAIHPLRDGDRRIALGNSITKEDGRPTRDLPVASLSKKGRENTALHR
jgi:hypothetical protein